MSYEIINETITEVDKLAQNAKEGKSIITRDLRQLSMKQYKKINNKEINHILNMSEILLNERSWALGVIAYDWAYKVRKQYTEQTYDIFYKWLKEYVRGWGDCDDFCTHAFGTLVMNYKSLFKKIVEWTKDEDFWVRRASAVILIPAISKDNYQGIDPFIISDKLLADEHDLVQKGNGWMLKILSQKDKEAVKNYLLQNYQIIPRTTFRYALQKFDKETRKNLMSL